MEYKVISITEKTPRLSTLDDGLYIGTWGAYVIKVMFDDKLYELKTEKGIRGVGVNVIVEVRNGIATFETIKNLT